MEKERKWVDLCPARSSLASSERSPAHTRYVTLLAQADISSVALPTVNAKKKRSPEIVVRLLELLYHLRPPAPRQKEILSMLDCSVSSSKVLRESRGRDELLHHRYRLFLLQAISRTLCFLRSGTSRIMAVWRKRCSTTFSSRIVPPRRAFLLV